jgi:hypothetical protein
MHLGTRRFNLVNATRLKAAWHTYAWASNREGTRPFMPIFRVPIVLMAQDSRGRPTFFGRQDLARFMSRVPLQAVRWKEYTLS